MTKNRLAALGFAALALAALIGFVRSELPSNARLKVSDAWAMSTAPGAEVAVGYAFLRNDTDRTLVISAVSSDAADAAEMHETTTRDGVMRMRHLEQGLSLAAGETARLQPGGTHLMLLGLHRPLRVGDAVPLHFKIADGREVFVVSVSAPVRDQAF